LREELDSIDEYLDIEVIRFGPQLQVEKEIDPAALDVLVPSMILQPLVENSIKHGLSRKVGGGRILIRVKRGPSSASIEVVDDGLGMDGDRLGTALHDGIGLSNVNERLRVIYGEACQLRIQSEPEAGTSVSMEIPNMSVPEERVSA
jgi:two-component system LytT family sensor kinase